mmetsp:Transcript_9806/g.59688  ORF Transcript_9806/g.59688 Transcript_9806/m.59688 type:complete len:345 (+) Transcript_9806:3754-4788(+)
MTCTMASSETDEISSTPPGTGARKLESPSFHQRVLSSDRSTQISPAMSCLAGSVNEQVCVGTSFPPISYFPLVGTKSVSIAISLTVVVPGGAIVSGGSSHIRRLSLDTPQWATRSTLQSETMSTLVEPSSCTKAATNKDALSPKLKRRRHWQAGLAAASATYGSSGDFFFADSGTRDFGARLGFLMSSRMSKFCVLASEGGGGATWGSDVGFCEGTPASNFVDSSAESGDALSSSALAGVGNPSCLSSVGGSGSGEAGSFKDLSTSCRVIPDRSFWESSAVAASVKSAPSGFPAFSQRMYAWIPTSSVGISSSLGDGEGGVSVPLISCDVMLVPGMVLSPLDAA